MSNQPQSQPQQTQEQNNTFNLNSIENIIQDMFGEQNESTHILTDTIQQYIPDPTEQKQDNISIDTDKHNFEYDSDNNDPVKRAAKMFNDSISNNNPYNFINTTTTNNSIPGAILSNQSIIKQIYQGNIIIQGDTEDSGYNQDNLNNTSYDVTLGQFYYEMTPARYGSDVYNPYSKTQTEYMFCQQSAVKTSELKKLSPLFAHSNNLLNLENIDDDDYIILLPPGTSILVHTREFVGSINYIKPIITSKSPLNRILDIDCNVNNNADVGYFNRWTIKITNHSYTKKTIPLVVGTRIAQISFQYTDPVTSDSNVGQDINIFDIIPNWTPDQMLPKLYLDREIVAKQCLKDASETTETAIPIKTTNEINKNK